VRVAQLIFNDTAVQKLGRRGIEPAEIAQLPANRVVGARNPHPRGAGSRLMIGRTDGGRLLTVAVEPDPLDDAVWHVRTAWDASPRERVTYHRAG
jgi:hypothetical protein